MRYLYKSTSSKRRQRIQKEHKNSKVVKKLTTPLLKKTLATDKQHYAEQNAAQKVKDWAVRTLTKTGGDIEPSEKVGRSWPTVGIRCVAHARYILWDIFFGSNKRIFKILETNQITWYKAFKN